MAKCMFHVAEGAGPSNCLRAEGVWPSEGFREQRGRGRMRVSES